MFFLHIYKPQHKIQASHFIINRTIYIPLKSAREQFPEHLHTRKKRKRVCMRNVQQKMFLMKIRNRFQLTNFITSMCWKSWKGAHIQAYETPKEEILTADIKLGGRWVAYLKQTATHTQSIWCFKCDGPKTCKICKSIRQKCCAQVWRSVPKTNMQGN